MDPTNANEESCSWKLLVLFCSFKILAAIKLQARPMRIYGDILVNVDYRIFFFFFFAVSFSCTSFWTLYILFAFKHMPKHLPGCQSEFKPICSSTYACFFFFFLSACKDKKSVILSLSYFFFFTRMQIQPNLSGGKLQPTQVWQGCQSPLKTADCYASRMSWNLDVLFFSNFFLTRSFELAEGINIII